MDQELRICCDFLKESAQSDNSVKYLKLKLDVETRWNSKFDMLYVALRMRPTIDALVTREPGYKEYATSAENCGNVSKILNLLKPF